MRISLVNPTAYNITFILRFTLFSFVQREMGIDSILKNLPCGN